MNGSHSNGPPRRTRVRTDPVAGGVVPRDRADIGPPTWARAAGGTARRRVATRITVDIDAVASAAAEAYASVDTGIAGTCQGQGG